MDVLDISFHLRQGGGVIFKELGHPNLLLSVPDRPCIPRLARVPDYTLNAILELYTEFVA